MASWTVTGSGTQLAGHIINYGLRIYVTDFGTGRQLDPTAPQRWMDLGWVAAIEHIVGSEDTPDGDYIGALHWVMFEHQTFKVSEVDIPGGFDGFVWSLRSGVEVTVSEIT